MHRYCIELPIFTIDEGNLAGKARRFLYLSCTFLFENVSNAGFI